MTLFVTLSPVYGLLYHRKDLTFPESFGKVEDVVVVVAGVEVPIRWGFRRRARWSDLSSSRASSTMGAGCHAHVRRWSSIRSGSRRGCWVVFLFLSASHRRS